MCFDLVTIRQPQAGVFISQENHYYPFGMNLSGVAVNTLPSEMPSKEQYNGGSELEDDLLGAEAGNYSTPYRRYDATIGRFLGVDPLAGAYADQGPSVFAGDDPVNFQDPTGLWPTTDYFGNMGLTGGRGHDSFGFSYSNPHLDPTGSGIGMGVGPTGEYNPWVAHEVWNGPSASEAELRQLARSVGLNARYNMVGGVAVPLFAFLINYDAAGNYNNSVSYLLGEFALSGGANVAQSNSTVHAGNQLHGIMFYMQGGQNSYVNGRYSDDAVDITDLVATMSMATSERKLLEGGPGVLNTIQDFLKALNNFGSFDGNLSTTQDIPVRVAAMVESNGNDVKTTSGAKISVTDAATFKRHLDARYKARDSINEANPNMMMSGNQFDSLYIKTRRR
jgi:RHS repeat-associated protein